MKGNGNIALLLLPGKVISTGYRPTSPTSVPDTGKSTEKPKLFVESAVVLC